MAVLTNPVAVLLDDADPVRRSQAHLQLGRQALARRDLDLAREHLEQAVDLDPTDEEPKKLLAKIEPPRRRRWFSLF